jgi:hypothetical protein
MTVHRTSNSEVEKLVSDERVECSFCHNPFVPVHILSVEVDRDTGNVEEILATCDRCTETLHRFVSVIISGVLDIDDVTDRIGDYGFGVSSPPTGGEK